MVDRTTHADQGKCPARAPARRRRWGLLLCILGVGAAALIGLALTVGRAGIGSAVFHGEARLPWTSPERRIEQFVAAAARDDPAAMLALADPAEVKRLGLTPAKLRSMLMDAAGSTTPVRLGTPRPEPLNPRQSRFNRWANVAIQDPYGVPARGIGSPTIQAYTTDSGWRIGISNFLYGVDVARNGMAGRKLRYAALCVRHGVAAELLWTDNAQWERLPVPGNASVPASTQSR
jgi:hypothetical protein